VTFQKAMDGPWGPAVFMLLAFLLRSTALPPLAIDGVTPDLVLAVVVMAALRQGAWRGAIFGLFGGLLEDVVTGRLIGMHALGLMLGGAAAGLLRRRLYPDPWFVPLLGVFLALLVQQIVVVATFALAHFGVHDFPLLAAIEYIYTAPFAYIIRPVFYRPEAPA
jgi:rod shape-determining protein MreD